jgi:hypothetical protein
MAVSTREGDRLKRQVRELLIGLQLLGAEHRVTRELAAILHPRLPTEMDLYAADQVYQPLGPGWWAAAGQACGASKRQTKLAAALVHTENVAAAGRLAGYRVRQSAHMAARSVKVQELLERANAEMGRISG